jgi:hypothetical protein
MEQTSGDEKALLQLAYGTLPLQDAGSADFALLQSFARHALRLRRESPFCRDVPEDIFLHFVFYPRVNSENLTDCRPFFYEQLAARVAGLAGEAAILEVNRWCGENMTYQSTDERTQSPLTSYNCGLGRCGEESVLAVTALRSVGIPARQIYAPLWAHCDDNHAWVEAYSGGRWYFFGACEPEPILNRGWFSDASSRAPLACYRTFFDFRGPCLAADEQTERQGAALLYNVTEHYALTTRLTVRAVTADGRPAPGAKIRADVFNMAALRPVLQNETDARGEFSVRLGRGSYHLEAADADLHAETEILLKDEPLDVTLTLLEHEDTEQVRDVDFSAPAASPVNRTVLTRGQQLESSETLARCAAMRLARLAGCWKPEYASFGPELEAILRAAGKNAAELYDFYAAQQAADRPLALALLQSLAPKDWRDVSRAVLEDHFAARAAQSEHFVGEVLCPRVGHEMLEPWRAAVREAFPGGGAYAGDPQRLMEEIRERFPDGPGRYYAPLWLTPLAALRCGHADETGRRVLFVAAMRAAGLPARLNPADGAAEYWAGGAYHTVCGVHEAKKQRSHRAAAAEGRALRLRDELHALALGRRRLAAARLLGRERRTALRPPAHPLAARAVPPGHDPPPAERRAAVPAARLRAGGGADARNPAPGARGLGRADAQPQRARSLLAARAGRAGDAVRRAAAGQDRAGLARPRQGADRAHPQRISRRGGRAARDGAARRVRAAG